VAQRDVIWGWIVLLLRATQWFNPLAQAVGRHAIRDIEWRADDRAVAATGAPLALASALLEYARRSGDRFLGLPGRGRLRAIEQRCRRLASSVSSPGSGAACPERGARLPTSDERGYCGYLSETPRRQPGWRAQATGARPPAGVRPSDLMSYWIGVTILLVFVR
jgi:hypothetical protein